MEVKNKNLSNKLNQLQDILNSEVDRRQHAEDENKSLDQQLQATRRERDALTQDIQHLNSSVTKYKNTIARSRTRLDDANKALKELKEELE